MTEPLFQIVLAIITLIIALDCLQNNNYITFTLFTILTFLLALL